MKRIVVCSLFLIMFFSGLSFSIIRRLDCSKLPDMPWEFNCNCGGEREHCILFYSRMCACGYQWLDGTCWVILKNCNGDEIAEIECGIPF